METEKFGDLKQQFASILKRRATFLVPFFVYLIHKFYLLILVWLNLGTVFQGGGWPELIDRWSTYDANIYLRIAERGYNYWQLFSPRPIEFSFLPGWPWLLKYLHLLLNLIPNNFFSLAVTGILVNQILLFPIIYLTLKICQKLGYNLRSSIAFSVLFLVYPASIFLNFNYNEGLFLVGLLLFIYLWQLGKRNLALLFAVPFVLVRINILAFVYGVVFVEVTNHFQFWNLNLFFQNFQYNLNLGKIWLRSRQSLIVYLLLFLSMPLVLWFGWQQYYYHQIKYFTTQRLYFNRQSAGLKGLYYSFVQSLQVLVDPEINLFPNNKIKGLFSLNSFLGLSLLFSHFGVFDIYNKIPRYCRAFLTILILIWSVIFALKHNPSWNNALVGDIYLNILPLFVIFVGLMGLWRNPKLRFWLIPTIICLYLPLSTSTFSSMDRYIIQSPFLFLGFFDYKLRKNRWLYLLVMIYFVAGQALLLHRFSYFQWAG